MEVNAEMEAPRTREKKLKTLSFVDLRRATGRLGIDDIPVFDGDRQSLSSDLGLVKAYGTKEYD